MYRKSSLPKMYQMRILLVSNQGRLFQIKNSIKVLALHNNINNPNPHVYFSKGPSFLNNFHKKSTKDTPVFSIMIFIDAIV